MDVNVWKNECFKYLSLGRNALAVIIGTVLAYVLHVNGLQPFELTGKQRTPRRPTSPVSAKLYLRRESGIGPAVARRAAVRAGDQWRAQGLPRAADAPGLFGHRHSADFHPREHRHRQVLL